MKAQIDRLGNPIGDGSYNVDYDILDFSEYPQIYTDVSRSETTETVYVTYINNDNLNRIIVRFSNHTNNAIEFGDQLDGNFASRNEVLYYLGLKKRTFIPNTYLSIDNRHVSKKDIAKGIYEEAELTIKEMYDLGKDADLSNFVGKLAKGSNYLIIGNKVNECIDKYTDRLGIEKIRGKCIYE